MEENQLTQLPYLLPGTVLQPQGPFLSPPLPSLVVALCLPLELLTFLHFRQMRTRNNSQGPWPC